MTKRLCFALSASLLVGFGSVAACVGDEAATTANGDGGTAPDGGGTTPVDSSTGPNVDASARDASGGTDATTTDAGADAAPLGCDLTKDFGAPQSLPNVNTAAVEDSARVSPDGTELYVSRQDGTTPKSVRLYRFTKNVGGDWGNGAAVGELSQNSGVGATPETSNGSATFDGNDTVYYSVFRSPWMIYTSKRPPAGAWGTPTAVTLPTPGTANGREFPWFSGGSKRLYFMSDIGTVAASFRLFVSTLNVATFGVAVPITVTAPGVVGFYAPVLTPDELTMYFAGANASGRSIYKATRLSAANSDFGTATAVAELNGTTRFDQPTWISPDGCEILFASNRSGAFDIYRARKPTK